jgi:hypothetical protein
MTEILVQENIKRLMKVDNIDNTSDNDKKIAISQFTNNELELQLDRLVTPDQTLTNNITLMNDLFFTSSLFIKNLSANSVLANDITSNNLHTNSITSTSINCDSVIHNTQLSCFSIMHDDGVTILNDQSITIDGQIQRFKFDELYVNNQLVNIDNLNYDRTKSYSDKSIHFITGSEIFCITLATTLSSGAFIRLSDDESIFELKDPRNDTIYTFLLTRDNITIVSGSTILNDGLDVNNHISTNSIIEFNRAVTNDIKSGSFVANVVETDNIFATKLSLLQNLYINNMIFDNVINLYCNTVLADFNIIHTNASVDNYINNLDVINVQNEITMSNNLNINSLDSNIIYANNCNVDSVNTSTLNVSEYIYLNNGINISSGNIIIDKLFVDDNLISNVIDTNNIVVDDDCLIDNLTITNPFQISNLIFRMGFIESVDMNDVFADIVSVQNNISYFDNLQCNTVKMKNIDTVGYILSKKYFIYFSIVNGTKTIIDNSINCFELINNKIQIKLIGYYEIVIRSNTSTQNNIDIEINENDNIFNINAIHNKSNLENTNVLNNFFYVYYIKNINSFIDIDVSIDSMVKILKY